MGKSGVGNGRSTAFPHSPFPHSPFPSSLARRTPMITSWLARLLPQRAPSPRLRGEGRGEGQHKAQTLLAQSCFAFDRLAAPAWAPRDYAAFAREGFMQNAVVYRAVRMIAEA